MTNRELLTAPAHSLTELDKQRLFLLRAENVSMPCPACRKPVNAFEAAGIDFDAYDLLALHYQYRCPGCDAELEQVIPFFTAGPHLWLWQIKHAWLQEQLRKAKAFDEQAKNNNP